MSPAGNVSLMHPSRSGSVHVVGQFAVNATQVSESESRILFSEKCHLLSSQLERGVKTCVDKIVPVVCTRRVPQSTFDTISLSYW